MHAKILFKVDIAECCNINKPLHFQQYFVDTSDPQTKKFHVKLY